ncbi:MAG: 3-isopropylmalate dehydratase large subunit [Deltaproteobacteria bacterium]|nr:3-isopropylmalate dehydratase large subunit [Deltaproteobacteria bacterium]
MSEAVAGAAPRTLLDKIWDAHVVVTEPGCPSVLYVDLHLVHEVTSPQAFSGLRARGIGVRRPDRTLATMDHITPTRGGLATLDAESMKMVAALERGAAEFGIPLYRLGERGNGIVHVMGPELGATRPGMTIVCGDSHTSTHGAFGALAFGIGTSEVEHVLATQCLLQRKPKAFEVRVDGRLAPGVSGKDLILAVIAKLGIGGGTGSVFEFRGEAISALSMEARMTVCNMSIEAGARAGLIAPDAKTWEFLRGRPLAPKGEEFEAMVAAGSDLKSDEGATFEGGSIVLDGWTIAPMITWGTNPGMGMAIDASVPDPATMADPGAKAMAEKALKYMGFEGGQPLLGKAIDVVFIGSCTNSRLSDLQAAADIVRGKKVADGVRMLVVPGSVNIKREAEALGLDRIFMDAGAEWRDAGCSMCIAMNGDLVPPGQLAVSTSNRNFEGRQGPGSRTLLASPATAAASAVRGAVADPREVA